MSIRVNLKQLSRPFSSWWTPRAATAINQALSDSTYTSVDIYDMDGKQHMHEAGTREKMVIFNHANRKGYPTGYNSLENSQPIFGIDNPFTEFLITEGKGKLIVSENGVAVAEFFPEVHTLNILFDLMFMETDYTIAIFKEIMVQVNKFGEEERNKFSWVKTSDKSFLTNYISSIFKSSNDELLRNKLNKVREYEETIESYRREIFAKTRSLESERKLVMALQEGQSADKQVIADLSNIAALPKVTDVRVEGDMLSFKTIPLICTDDSSGKRYNVGSFNVKISLKIADVRFFGDTPRMGYWTPSDPHPHVNGSSGTACLGSIASTVAELSAQHQYYALAITLIDFIESVNTSDPAGRRVTNWDRVDENGNIIPVATEGDDEEDDEPEHDATCEHCGDRYLFEDRATAIGEEGEDIHICPHCRDNEFHYEDDRDRFVRD